MSSGTRAACAAFIAVAAVAAAPSAFAADRESRERVVAVDGVAKHRLDLRVEIVVAVPPGASERAVTAQALESQGAHPAQPVESAGYTFSGLHWEALPVVQYYNPSGATTPAASTALTNTHSAWNTVQGSTYAITYGKETSRCPSLVKGCRGGQRFDGFNDVGWSRLSGSTLGVTWYGTSIDEADMSINTRYTWTTGCKQVPGAYDLESVYLHENGHVAGLGHSSDPSAVMYAYYQTARCTLAEDDRAGLAALY